MSDKSVRAAGKLHGELAAANERISELEAANGVALGQVRYLTKDQEANHNQLAAEREVSDKLEAALKAAKDWLEGWASAEPYLSDLNAALAEVAAIRAGGK